MKRNLIISCEHAGNLLPEKYKSLFVGADEIVNSHRGWDPGAIEIASSLAQNLNAPIFSMVTSRLVIEMNRSTDSHELFSDYTRQLPDSEKIVLLNEFYFPYRDSIVRAISAMDKPVAHLSIHSFTSVLNDIEREVDIGLLFDPSREKELEFCNTLQQSLQKLLPKFRIRFNEPYLGTDDGFTTTLRKKYPENEYLGIEIEVNQKFYGTIQLKEIVTSLSESLRIN
ncbi:MAG: N-formylglutamate amidohydrolase [Cyclobacteriaceae bacterium]|nr:N-formylglutamate amidohydrolase [Cyclobacteriaceae bacterium]